MYTVSLYFKNLLLLLWYIKSWRWAKRQQNHRYVVGALSCLSQSLFLSFSLSHSLSISLSHAHPCHSLSPSPTHSISRFLAFSLSLPPSPSALSQSSMNLNALPLRIPFQITAITLLKPINAKPFYQFAIFAWISQHHHFTINAKYRVSFFPRTFHPSELKLNLDLSFYQCELYTSSGRKKAKHHTINTNDLSKSPSTVLSTSKVCMTEITQSEWKIDEKHLGRAHHSLLPFHFPPTSQPSPPYALLPFTFRLSIPIPCVHYSSYARRHDITHLQYSDELWTGHSHQDKPTHTYTRASDRELHHCKAPRVFVTFTKIKLSASKIPNFIVLLLYVPFNIIPLSHTIPSMYCMQCVCFPFSLFAYRNRYIEMDGETRVCIRGEGGERRMCWI